MSEQENKSGGGADPSVMLVEQSAASRHKQAFHPIDVPDDAPKEHHKRSKAPAVPSVKENLKDINAESKERKESERAMTSEKYKHNVASKLSSSMKRRGSSPESITLAPLVVDVKKSSTTPSQPIPAQVSETKVIGSDISTVKNVEKKEDEEKDDSITEEIADMRTPEVAKVSSEWENSGDKEKEISQSDKNYFESVKLQGDSGDIKKKVSWIDKDYLDKVNLEDPLSSKRQPCLLERKSSLGPCFHAAAPFGRPSGISICASKMLPVNHENEEYDPKKPVINITLSNKCLLNKTIHRDYNPVVIQNYQVPEGSKLPLFDSLRKRIANMSDKIKNAFV